MIKRPYKATDWDPEHPMEFPVVILPKVDGVRGLHNHTSLCSRTFEPFANTFTQRRYNVSQMAGFDFEIAAGPPTSPSLCRDTTSALNSHGGEPYLELWVFDLLDAQTEGMGYLDRLVQAHARVDELKLRCVELPWAANLRKMPYRVVKNYAELEAAHREHVALGYEGSIVRSIDGKYKFGTSTVREGGYLRIKDFAHDEILVEELQEGQTNTNTLESNNLGLAKRSTHQENMVPNGMVGALVGRTVKDIYVNGGKKVIPVGSRVTVSAGKLTEQERLHLLANPHEIVGKFIKFQHFPHGVKDKLRFTTFQSVRPDWDMPKD